MVELIKALVPWPIQRASKLIGVLLFVSVLAWLFSPWGLSLKRLGMEDAVGVVLALASHEIVGLLSNLRDLLKLRVMVGSRQAGVRRETR